MIKGKKDISLAKTPYRAGQPEIYYRELGARISYKGVAELGVCSRVKSRKSSLRRKMGEDDQGTTVPWEKGNWREKDASDGRNESAEEEPDLHFLFPKKGPGRDKKKRTMPALLDVL